MTTKYFLVSFFLHEKNRQNDTRHNVPQKAYNGDRDEYGVKYLAPYSGQCATGGAQCTLGGVSFWECLKTMSGETHGIVLI